MIVIVLFFIQTFTRCQNHNLLTISYRFVSEGSHATRECSSRCCRNCCSVQLLLAIMRMRLHWLSPTQMFVLSFCRISISNGSRLPRQKGARLGGRMHWRWGPGSSRNCDRNQRHSRGCVGMYLHFPSVRGNVDCEQLLSVLFAFFFFFVQARLLHATNR